MPQFLEIEREGERIAVMMTGRLNGTNYRVSWYSNMGINLIIPIIDTRVECQPSDPAEQQIDFQNDFTHARRAIAAASNTARAFLDKLLNEGISSDSNIDEIQIRLRTNCFDRGKITIRLQEGETANLRMEIGSGPIRYPNSQPSQGIVYNRTGINPDEQTSSLTLALQILDSTGSWMLEKLEENT